MLPSVAFLPGNGHAEERLERARAAAQAEGFRITTAAPNTGAPSFDAMLEELAPAVESADLCYATGIGGLVLLALRARGRAAVPALLQGPVLWGLERRRFPKVMRLPLMPRALTLALRTPLAQRRFVSKHFREQHPPAFLRAFFRGYRDAGAFQRWFEWLTPGLLRDLEQRFEAAPGEGALAGITVWWGQHDHVVTTDELRVTEAALQHRFPLEEFDAWGHYPMIDDPTGWAREVALALAAARTIPG